MQAYFCVVRTGIRKLDWFVSRDPGHALASQEKRATLVVLKLAPDSATAYQMAEQFARLSPSEKWKAVLDQNPRLREQSQPAIPVVAGATVPQRLTRGLGPIIKLVLEASRVGDVEAVRRYYGMIRENDSFEEPDGGTCARKPGDPPPSPRSHPEPWPSPYQEMAVGFGICFSCAEEP
ncbi:MAG: hypothetical protein ABUL72_04605 [Armatimonadota bacterium]